MFFKSIDGAMQSDFWLILILFLNKIVRVTASALTVLRAVRFSRHRTKVWAGDKRVQDFVKPRQKT